jgi:DNA-binding NarL/FixJ family response regulator
VPRRSQRGQDGSRATGAAAPRQRSKTGSDLTARESQIARLAGEGLLNAEIGTRLFLSLRTVEYHLHKILMKTGVNARHGLANVEIQF